MDNRVDEIDKRILYYLASDARNTSAPAIAKEVDVTPATIRNRIRQLEDQGIIQGYTAAIDYEQIGGRVSYLFRCTAPIPDRDRLAKEVLDISGVIHVRKLLAGQANLNVRVVGRDTEDISRISRELAALGLDIEAEDAIEEELHHPYHPFGPGDEPARPSLTDFMSLTGAAEVIEFTVSEGAEITGMTIEEAVEEEVLGEDMLIVGIERDGTVITPKGDTKVKVGDLITLFARGPIERTSLDVFGAGNS